VQLFPEEAVAVADEGRKLGLNISIKPNYWFYDEISRKRLVLFYSIQLVDGNCPFLRGGLCAIYSRRPLICRCFPYVPEEIDFVFDNENKQITVDVRYATSVVCPLARSASLLNHRRYVLEFEYKLRSYLFLLSTLWRKGVVELRKEGGGEYQNLYELLSKHFPFLEVFHRKNRREKGC